ncbi:HAMP domain-containing sensor histidine kinase [Corallincola platygyrae]|uniref:histidine kinase n=1 Tax=Corallincola platygyrae TaxID=1193278 RepID=A0ABW4XPT6_9GAMM
MTMTSRRLTFIYFSIVAFAIIGAHIAIFDLTLDDIESLYARNRLNAAYESNRIEIEQLDAGRLVLSPSITAYVGRDSLPQYVTLPDDFEAGSVIEQELIPVEFPDLTGDQPEYQYFLLFQSGPKPGQEIFLLNMDMSYEQAEDEVLLNQTKQLAMSLMLLVVSLMVVLRISTHLSRPLSMLAEKLRIRKPEDFSPLELPDVGTNTTEVELLVGSFNQYQQQIETLLDRERSFNRYASHELRSPLMVIRGASSLLKQSADPAFVDKQRQRIEVACTEMNDIVTTLLSLTRDEKDADQALAREISEQEIIDICIDHEHLLQGRNVSWRVHVAAGTQLAIPEVSFKILLGNLIKNAFAYTEQGSVDVELDSEVMRVKDTGAGLSADPRGIEGYGLGLVIVRDICRKYHWAFNLKDQSRQGCVAEVVFKHEQTPSDQPVDS